MLIGEYTHTLDEKKRISLPVKFRKELGGEVVITPGLDKCLFVFPISEWEKISSKLSDTSILQKDPRSFNRHFFGQASVVDIDSNGRILLPERLKEKAGLGKNVVFIGVQSRVEMWDETTWIQYRDEIEKGADDLAEKLGTIGIL